MMTDETRIPISDLNSNLTCMLCNGYYIDAVTIIECLHSFCRTCLVNYLHTSKFCPVCDVMIHKTKPLCNIRSDKTLQNLVYKLVPGLYTNEMKRRRDYYEREKKKDDGKKDKKMDSEDLTTKDVTMVEGDESVDNGRVTGDDLEELCISLSLQMRLQAPASDTQPEHPVRYLQCPPAFTIRHLSKFIRLKYDLPPFFHIDVYHRNDSLDRDYTLLDVAYICGWKRRTPLQLFYTICEKPPTRHSSASSRTSSITSCDTNTSLTPAPKNDRVSSTPKSASPNVVKINGVDHAKDSVCEEQPVVKKPGRGRPRKNRDVVPPNVVTNGVKRKINTPSKKGPPAKKSISTTPLSKAQKDVVRDDKRKDKVARKPPPPAKTGLTLAKSKVTPLKRKVSATKDTPVRTKLQKSTAKERQTKNEKDMPQPRRKIAKKTTEKANRVDSGRSMDDACLIKSAHTGIDSAKEQSTPAVSNEPDCARDKRTTDSDAVKFIKPADAKNSKDSDKVPDKSKIAASGETTVDSTVEPATNCSASQVSASVTAVTASSTTSVVPSQTESASNSSTTKVTDVKTTTAVTAPVLCLSKQQQTDDTDDSSDSDDLVMDL